MGPRGFKDLLVALISLLCHSRLVNAGPYPQSGSPCDAATEYYENNLRLCCKKCSPGYYAQRRCTQSLDTDCQPCPPGEFTEFWNYILECKLCPACDQRRGLVVRENCSATVKTKCQCVSGMHCVDVADCTDCELHRSCPPGQQMAHAGTRTHDTNCEPCPPGTFQRVESLERCQRHMNCSARRLFEVREGTAKSDAICEDSLPNWAGGLTSPPAVWRPTKNLDPPPANSYFLVVVVTMGILFLCVLLGGIAAYVWNKQRDEGQKANTNTQTVTDTDRTSLESNQPLLSNKQASPPPHQPLPASGTGGPVCEEAQAQARLGSGESPGWPDGDWWSQTSGGDLGERGTPVRAEAQFRSPGGGQGLDGGPGPRSGPRAHPSPQPESRPEGQARPGAQPGNCGGHGLLGLNGCHVGSFESNLTVNGPLYIYNGPPFPGHPPTDHQEYHHGDCCQETGSVPAQGPSAQEPGPGPWRDSGGLTGAVQECGGPPAEESGDPRLVTAQQEEAGKDFRLPTQEVQPGR